MGPGASDPCSNIYYYIFVYDQVLVPISYGLVMRISKENGLVLQVKEKHYYNLIFA